MKNMKNFIYLLSGLACLTLPGLAMSDTAPKSASIIIRDQNQAQCSLTPPAMGSGITRQFEMTSAGNNCHNIKPRSIEFDLLPSATTILLTDDDWCQTTTTKDQTVPRNEEETPVEPHTSNFWMELKTTRKLSSSGIIEVVNLFSYNEEQIVKEGFQLLRKYHKPGSEIRDALSCIRVTAGRSVGMPPPPPYATTGSHTWSDPIKEANSNYSCPVNQILTGRRHYGDENKNTGYRCGVATREGPLTLKDRTWSVEIKESGDGEKPNRGIYFSCPGNQVMTGRQHAGDENGMTKYECATVVDSLQRELAATPGNWSSEVIEKNHTFNCPDNSVMIGRWHEDDENGPTRYRCGTLR
ncbi:hypothetical protein [Pseudomonas akapageensis]|uniref:hypothetical protein n=1 Tax=Pseudomonas akapageensis TaxID=2609961 RepID=UPI001407EC4C|nr:hypothetical protein [Pseudomonas akapageensis]